MVFIDPGSCSANQRLSAAEVACTSPFRQVFEKIVLAERLREVRALVGFTRIESPGDYENPAEFPEPSG